MIHCSGARSALATGTIEMLGSSAQCWDIIDKVCVFCDYEHNFFINSIVDAIASKFSRFEPDPRDITLRQHKVVLSSIHCEGHENSLFDCLTVSSEDCYFHFGVICEGMDCMQFICLNACLRKAFLVDVQVYFSFSQRIPVSREM